MVTTWTDQPVVSGVTGIKAQHITELRTAVTNAGGAPPGGWIDPTLTTNTPVRAAHVIQLREGIQQLWTNRGMGTIGRWSARAGAAPQADTPSYGADVNDLRAWFNNYELAAQVAGVRIRPVNQTLRGVHWFNNTRADLPQEGWNVEAVIGVSNPDNTYHFAGTDGVQLAINHCIAARQYGLATIVRLDWKPGLAVPGPADYGSWIANFNHAVVDLLPYADLFIVGNEPTIEGAISSSAYADAFNALYAEGVDGAGYLAAGPGVWSEIPGVENDLLWLERVAANIPQLDGFALHTYGSPERCSADPRQSCVIAELEGDGGFRRFRDYADVVASQYQQEIAAGVPLPPIYLTEFNTHGFGNQGPATQTPADNYPTTFMQQAYEEVRNYNLNLGREGQPENHAFKVHCLCWFVDDDRQVERSDSTWVRYALSNDTSFPRLAQARIDFISADTYNGL